jgi:hypothetical protein
MIRKTMLGLSLLALSTTSAFAAAPAKTHAPKVRVVAQSPAPTGDTAAPADEKDGTAGDAKGGKKVKKPGKKAEAMKNEGAGKEMKPADKAPAPAGDKAETKPAPEKTPAK